MADLNSTLDKSGSGQKPLEYAGENDLAAKSDEAEPAELLPLSENAQKALVEIVMKAVKAESFARKQEVMEARRQRYYERGDQNLYYDAATTSFRPITDSGLEMPSYSDVYNIFRPNLRTLVSVLSQNSPGINFVPNDLMSSADVQAAALAEKMRHKLYRDVDMSVIQTEAARLFCTDSRVVAYVREEGGQTVITLHGVLESKVPIYTRGGITKWQYLVLSEEVDTDASKDEYPDANIDAPGAKDTSGDASYERYARIGVLSGTKQRGSSDVFKGLSTRHTAWIKPSRYRGVDDDAMAEVKAHFPSGVRVVVIAGQFCEAMESGMDGLHVAFPAPGDGQNRPSLLKDLVPLQDAFNDGMNQVREYFDYGIPATWFNTDAVDGEAVSQQKTEPGVMHPAEWSADNPLSNAFWQEAPAVLPSGLMEYLQTVQGSLSQFITGNFPSLYGAEAPSLETAQAYGMSHDNAMGNLSPAWGAMQRLLASVTKSGVVVMAQTIGDGEIAVQGKNGTTDSFRASDMLSGDFGCYPDSDSTFPETTASKRAAYQAMVTQVAQFEGGGEIIGQPDNLKLGLQLSGLEDFVVPGAEARDKQLREIEELLKSGPKADPTQPATDANGQPVPPQPTISVDEDYDYHQPEWDKCQQWMSSEERMREERKGNVLGIENVRLHGLQHKAVLDKQAAAAAQQAAAANAPPPPVQKPPTVAIAYKDVADPAAKAQILAEAGIQVSPESIEEEQGMTAAQDALPHVLAHQTAARKDFINVAHTAQQGDSGE